MYLCFLSPSATQKSSRLYFENLTIKQGNTLHSFEEGASFIEIPIEGISSLGFCALSWQRKLCAQLSHHPFLLRYKRRCIPNTPVPQFVLSPRFMANLLLFIFSNPTKKATYFVAKFWAQNSFSLSPLLLLCMLMWLHDDSCSS